MKKSELYQTFSNFRLSDAWNTNADPIVNSLPLVNEDIWILVLFLAGNAACRSQCTTAGKKTKAKMEPLIFLYHCFMCGLCFAALVMGCMLLDYETHVVSCSRLRSFSTYGFWGEVRMYSVYIAFLVKTCHVMECIWCHSLIPQIVSLMEGMICLMSMKFDASAHIWLGGMLHLPFLLFTNYLNAIQISRTEDARMMHQIRRKLVYLLLAAGSAIGIMHAAYTLSRPDCAFPRHWSLFALIYPILAYATYPSIFITPYAPRPSCSSVWQQSHHQKE